MNTQICDVNGTEIKEGDSIVYAVRDGSCATALRRGTVVGINLCLESENGFFDVITENGKHVALKYPNRIAVINRVNA